ncbi:class I SAM-dependent methyltransferase [Oceanobacillus damuensis]|uniref:class I SAM-dependent methyltransferase n=1 Tax=Oceanobacillus damuensis TaxID=937928 RepID=UPI000835AB44|nr:class I SAM-dependent methyltransferase [Oceanobacillus damuensis]
MEKTSVETLFSWLDETTELIQQHKNEPYLDSLAVTMDILFYEGSAEDMDDILSHKLQNALANIEFQSYDNEEIRKAVQLAILKGMKGSTQQQHLMTPETVGLIVGYLADKLTKGKEAIRVFDPVSGTGNLLTTVLGQLKQDVKAFASEVDPTLIQLSLRNANLQKKQVEFFHQDSLSPFLMEPVDLIVADLPVGYYPDDIRANDFELKADSGHSYAHHLLIEQSMKYTVDAGYLILVVPEFLFDSDQSDKLHDYLQQNAHIIGVIRLPETAFKSEKNAKSILILQKKGKHTNTPKQPLLVQMPSFKNSNAMADILGKMNAWFETYK